MPKLTIDGEEFEVPAGTSILEAALTRGREVPHYCYHKALSVAGNCRMCLVEVEKAPKLAIACGTPVAEGMVVRTDSEKVKEALAGVMEFLLINHPLDCPICDQAGECRLQDHAVSFGTGVSRYTEPKLSLNKAVDIGEHIMLDQERCIQCSRCTRFCDEVTQTHELAFFQRGERAQIGIYPDKRLDNPYSGNVVDLCPVGALTLKEFRFATRVWDLKTTPSICAGCARGCNVMVAVGRKQETMTSPGQTDDRIKRIVPRVNQEVNGHWICDEGRLSYMALEAAERLPTAQSPAGTAIEWDDAMTRVATLLAQAAEAGRAGMVLSPRLTSETLYAWKWLADRLRIEAGIQRIERGNDDDLLVRADKGANSRGAAWIFGSDASALLERAGRGEIETLIMLGDGLDPADTLRLGGDVLAGVKNIIYVGPFVDDAAREASLLVPAAAWSEEDGTFVNFEGRIQRVSRCHLPRGEGRPGWRVVADLATAAGLEPPEWGSAADVLASLAGSVDEFGGLTLEHIGLLGVAGTSAAAGA